MGFFSPRVTGLLLPLIISRKRVWLCLRSSKGYCHRGPFSYHGCRPIHDNSSHVGCYYRGGGSAIPAIRLSLFIAKLRMILSRVLLGISWNQMNWKVLLFEILYVWLIPDEIRESIQSPKACLWNEHIIGYPKSWTAERLAILRTRLLLEIHYYWAGTTHMTWLHANDLHHWMLVRPARQSQFGRRHRSSSFLPLAPA
jgi:hypothetical protein